MHGRPALPDGFEQFPYANAGAPRQGSIVLAQLNSFDSLNPFIPIGSAPDAAMRFVLQSMMIRSLDEPFSLYALVAQSVKMPDDRSEVIFNLDPNARFSDGNALTAEDVRFSFDLLSKNGKPFHRSSFGQVRKVEVIDPHRIRFDLKGSLDRELPFIIATMPIFAAHATDPTTFSSPTLKPIVGSGPYAFSSVQPGEKIVLKRRNDYWGEDLAVTKGLYNFDEIVYTFYRDSNSMFEAFKSGQYDYRLESDPNRWMRGYDVKAVENGSIRKESLQVRTPLGMTGFVFNTRRSLFADIRVRKALAALFDFHWVNRNLYFSTQVRSKGYFDNSDLSSIGHPASQHERALLASAQTSIPIEILDGTWTPPEPDASGHNDRELARQAIELLNEAGWELKGKVLRRKADGTPFSFEIMVGTAEQERLALNYRGTLARIGVDARVRRVDDVQFWRRAASFDFDMMQRTWPVSLSPGNEQRNRWGSQAADNQGSLNYAGVKSPAVDAALDALLAAREREEFVDAIRALDRLLISGFYVVPLFNVRDQWIAYSTKIAHPEPVPLLGAPIETWWRTEPRSGSTQ